MRSNLGCSGDCVNLPMDLCVYREHEQSFNGRAMLAVKACRVCLTDKATSAAKVPSTFQAKRGVNSFLLTVVALRHTKLPPWAMSLTHFRHYAEKMFSVDSEFSSL
jgi:hypothetical protein